MTDKSNELTELTEKWSREMDDSLSNNVKEKEKENEKAFKQIEITGKTNRYHIKKMQKNPSETLKRKEIQKSNIPEEYFTEPMQQTMIEHLYSNTGFSQFNIMKQMIERKLSSYKQQDTMKKIFNVEKFISFQQVIDKLYQCKLDCFYCKKKTFLLYELVREMNQWTLERMDNNRGHNDDNVVIACLDCNLKRRLQNKDAFLFTKQLIITREDLDV